MKVVAPLLSNQFVTLEPVNAHTVDFLVQWTLDPMAQGPYKRVPTLTADELRVLFRHGPDRHHFLIKRIADGQPLGRFYYRAWRFGGEPGGVDSQLNIFLADPCERGKGYGTAVSNWSSTTCWRVTTHGASVLTPL